MSKIISIKKCKFPEGVEILAKEERGITKRTYLFSLVITKENLEKIKEEMEK